MAKAGDPGVVAELLVTRPLLGAVGAGLNQLRQPFIGIDMHGAEFQHLECLAVLADPLLTIEHRSTAPFDGHCDHEKRG